MVQAAQQGLKRRPVAFFHQTGAFCTVINKTPSYQQDFKKTDHWFLFPQAISLKRLKAALINSILLRLDKIAMINVIGVATDNCHPNLQVISALKSN